MRMGMTTRSAGEPSAELLSWDSEFWGVRIGRAPSLMDEWALENTIGCMWMLIPAHEQAEIHRAEEGGARVMDVRVKLDRATEGGLVIARLARENDLELLVEIARKAFRGLTRFYADPRFPDERCDDLYENWIRDSYGGWAQAIIVMTDGFGDAAGFVTVHGDGNQTASIGLIAVKDRARGQGMGFALTESAVRWSHAAGYDHITVVTQGCNTAALRTFQGCGFRTCQTDVWLHKHFYD